MNLSGSPHNVAFVSVRDIIAEGFSVENALPSVINSLDLDALIQRHCLTFPLWVSGLGNITRLLSGRAWRSIFQLDAYIQIILDFFYFFLWFKIKKKGKQMQIRESI